MRRIFIIWGFVLAGLTPLYGQQDRDSKTRSEKETDRIELAKQNYTRLFGGEALTGEGTDPELMNILQKYIFGEVFRTGDLDIKTRELITCVSLATMQQLPQLKAHTGAALNVGVTPVELREAIYQSAPLIGFPKVLNALGAVNEAFKEKGIAVPLEKQATVTEANRAAKGQAIQRPLYGDTLTKALKEVPGGMGADVARFITEVHFGDFYTRKGLDVKTRELLTYCVLTVTGSEDQLRTHLKANLKVGNSRERLTAAVIQCMPYVGFPAAQKALRMITDEAER
jgi:4-carboxymuconolactone decarboxylase